MKNRWNLWRFSVLAVLGLLLGSAAVTSAATKLNLPLDDAWRADSIVNTGKENGDQWKFTIDKPGVVTLRIMSTGIGSGADMNLYSEDRTTCYANDFLSKGTADNPAVKTWRLRLMPGTFWVDIYGMNLTTGPYQIRASFEAQDPGDPERNNSFDTAAVLEPNAQMNGQICLNDQYDYFKITVPAEQEAWVWLYTNASKTYLRIFDENFVRITEKHLTRGTGDYVVQDTWEGTLSAGMYYVQVGGDMPYGAYETWMGTGTYRLKWGGSQLPVKVTSLSVSPEAKTLAAGSTFTASAAAGPSEAWNKAVKWSTSNKKVATVSTGGTVKGIRPGVAVITATTTDGSKIAAKCTVIVKPGKVQKVSAKAGSKAFTVSWKTQSGVSGYQVQYGTKANLKNSTLKAVKASKSKVTIRNLKKNRLYYVRVRAYAVLNGKTYYGAWSAKQKVRVK